MAELINKVGFSAVAYIPSSAPINNTVPQFLQDLPIIKNSIQTSDEPNFFTNNDGIIITDTSDPRSVRDENFMPKHISTSNVFAVIDHHFGHETDEQWTNQSSHLEVINSVKNWGLWG